MPGAVPVLLAVLVTLPAPLAFAEVANEPPLVDAGLDQTVTLGARVHLDGSGSRDPDGQVTGYAWSIRGPGGTHRPACPDCATTHFTPRAPGRYRVSVTASDDDGATGRDTLYVTVLAAREENATGPTVALSGPRNLDVGTTAVYRAAFERGDAPLARVRWEVDGASERERSLSATAVADSLSHHATNAGLRRLRVTVTDDAGRSATDTLRVRVAARPTPEAPAGPRTAPDPPATSRDPNDPPTVRIRGPEYADPGTRVAFEAAASDPDGRIARYRWGDGSDQRQRTRALPDAPGRDVALDVRVWDDHGATASDEHVVHLRPDAAIVGPERKCIDQGSLATFEADVDAGGDLVLAHEWENATPTGVWDERAFRRFDEPPGTVVDVGLTVRDEDGATDRTTTSVTVCPRPGNNTEPTIHSVAGAGVLLAGGQFRVTEPDAFAEDVLVRGGTATQVKLWARATDEESDVLTYTWTADGRLIGKMKLRNGELSSFFHKFTFPTKPARPTGYGSDWQEQRTVTLTVTDEGGSSATVTRDISFQQAGPPSRPVPMSFRLRAARTHYEVGERAAVTVDSKPAADSPLPGDAHGTYRLTWGDGDHWEFDPPQTQQPGFASQTFYHQFAAVGVYPVQISGPLNNAVQSTRNSVLLTIEKGRRYTEYHWQKILRYNDTVVSPTKPGEGYERTGVHHREVQTTNRMATVLPVDSSLLGPDWRYRGTTQRRERTTEYREAPQPPGPAWTRVERNVGTTSAFARWETVVFEDESDVLGDWQFVRTVDGGLETVRETSVATRKPSGTGWLRGRQVGTTRQGWEYAWFDSRPGGDWQYVDSRTRVERHTHGHDHDRIYVPGYTTSKPVTKTRTRTICGFFGCMDITETYTTTETVWHSGRWVGHDHDTTVHRHTSTEYRFRKPNYVPEYRWSRAAVRPDTDYEYRRKVYETVPTHRYRRTAFENRTYLTYGKTVRNVTEYYVWRSSSQTEMKTTLHRPDRDTAFGKVEKHTHYCGEDEGGLQDTVCKPLESQ